MPYVSPAAIVSGTGISKTTFGDIVKADLDYLANPPIVSVYNSASQNHATTAAWQALTFDSEIDDTNGMHSTVTNTSRFTVVTAGLYIVSAFAARGVGIRKNGTLATGPTHGASLVPTTGAAVGTATGICRPVRLIVGDWIELVAYQSSGGILAMTGSAASGYPHFSASWVSL
jgi:hypothetical protein